MTQLNKTVSDKSSSTQLVSLRPLVDVYENKEGVVLLADLPGVDSGQLDIQVEGNVLSLEGKAVHTKAESVKKELEMVPDGIYKRSFTLNDSLDLDNIDAELKSGLLTIKVPKKAAEVPKKVIVRAA